MNPGSTKIIAGFCFVLAAGAGGAGIILLRQSAPQFESTAAVRVVQEPSAANSATELITKVFLQNEAQVLRSDPILQKVVAQLDLNQEWGNRFNQGQPLPTAVVVERLKAWVQMAPEPGMTVLRIRATSDNDLEATKLADAIAAAYREYCLERQQRQAQEGIDTLRVSHQENEAKVQRARERVAQARRALDSAGSGPSPPPLRAEDQGERLRALQERYTRATMRHLTQSNQLARNVNLPAIELEKFTAQVARARAELTSAEAALQVEVKRQEAVRAYGAAQQELEQAELVFAPIKAAVDEKRRTLSSAETSAVILAETASVAVAVTAQRATTGQVCLAGAGVLLIAGVGLLLPRKTAVKG